MLARPREHQRRTPSANDWWAAYAVQPRATLPARSVGHWLWPRGGVIVVEPFRIHVADEALNDLRARLRHTRWPDQIPGIGWEQGTELDWLRRLVSYWAHEFDWRGWERRLNAFNHFTWEGIHFVYQRAAAGRGVPLILTHGWPSSFLDYVGMLPMLEHFDLVVPSLPGYGFSPRPPKVGINYRYVSERWHRLMSELGYSRYGASGYDFGAGVTTILALDHSKSVIGIHLTTLESDLAPVWTMRSCPMPSVRTLR